MMTVASLFESQAEATEAVDALAQSPFEDVEYRVYEHNMAHESDDVQAIGLPTTEPSVGGAGPVAIVSNVGTKLGNEDLSDFFRDAVENGDGVLVVAEVDEDRAPQLEAFFREHGGRTAADS